MALKEPWTPTRKSFWKPSVATKMNIDPPELVAAHIAAAIDQDRKRITIGFPESLFVKVNGAFPSLVDSALAKQANLMKPYAQ